MQEIISRTRGYASNLDDVSDIAKRIYENLAVESILKFTMFSKLKTETILIGKCKLWLDLKVSIFNSQYRSAVVVYDELGRELEHFNWVLFSVLTICKSVYFKTETDKTCTVRINADSFYGKTLKVLIGCRRIRMPLGHYFLDFRSFLSDFAVMKIALIFSECLKVSSLTAYVDSKFLAMWLFCSLDSSVKHVMRKMFSC